MLFPRRFCRMLLCLVVVFSLSACTVVKVADLAASTAIGVTAGTVKATGAVAGAAIPDGDDEEDEEDDEDEG